MSVRIGRRSPLPAPGGLESRGRRSDRVGDALLRALALGAALVTCALIVDIAYQLVHGSHLALSTFGLGFLTHGTWKPNFKTFGASTLLFGTAVSSAMALLLATPLAIAIAIYLGMLAPRGVRGVVGTLVEMLAAIPSVILGLWGILVFGPFIHKHLEPWLHDALGFIPLFGPPGSTGSSIFTAGLILTIMVVPIIASVSRDLFLTVPRELQEGAVALGATRWEVVRGVVLPSTASGIASAACLGLGRALGEAVAVAQVAGAGNVIDKNLFATGDTLAARIANQFAGATSALHTSALFYLALVLLVLGLATNLFAQWIGRHFDVARMRA